MATVGTAPTPSRRTSRAPRVRLTAVLAAVVMTLGAVAGCSASGSGSTAAPAAGGADKAQQGGAGAAAPGAAGNPAAGAATDRQVVKTGEIALTVDDPVKAASDVADVVDRFHGRIEKQELQSGVKDAPGWATMTVRVPADSMADAVTALHAVGTVTRYADTTQDVTTAARDLDSRIHATELSVTRMEELMKSATTTSELINAEQLLSDRQATLESLRSERASLADQVAYSTLTVSLTAPGAPEITPNPGPTSFLDGLAVGWHGLLTALRGLSVALGVVLPWVVLLGGLAWAAVVVTGRIRRARPPRPVPAGPQVWPQTGPGRPMTAPGQYGAPGQPDAPYLRPTAPPAPPTAPPTATGPAAAPRQAPAPAPAPTDRLVPEQAPPGQPAAERPAPQPPTPGPAA